MVVHLSGHSLHGQPASLGSVHAIYPGCIAAKKMAMREAQQATDSAAGVSPGEVLPRRAWPCWLPPGGKGVEDWCLQALVPCPANNLHIKPRLHTHGCVANPRERTAIASVCALPRARIHRFHLSNYLRDRTPGNNRHPLWEASSRSVSASAARNTGSWELTSMAPG
jgi:hypothetical protein